MKKLFYRLSGSRPFAKLFSIPAVLVLLAGTASAYLTTSPPSSSTGFTLSGPFTICQFFRPDLKQEVQVSVDSPSAFGGVGVDGGIYSVTLNGVAACGIPEANGTLQNFAFFSVNNVTFGCVKRTESVDGKTITYAEHFGDCLEGNLVSGNFTGIKGDPDLPVVGNIHTMLTYCGGGNPGTDLEGDLGLCVLNVGIEVGVNEQFFDRKVCPKDASTGRTVNGQIFAFKETIVNGQYRPGAVGACYCDSDLDGGAVFCGQGSTGEPITTNTAGANPCEFDWQKTGNESGDTINISGSPSQVNAAIYDDPVCPVRDIDTKTVRVCNGVTPRQFKIQTDQGRLALTFQISEGDCRSSLQGLVEGDTRLIYATGAFKDGTRFEGADDVVVVGQ